MNIGDIYEHVETQGSRYEIASFAQMKDGKNWVDAVIYRKLKDYQNHFVRSKDNFTERFKLIKEVDNIFD